MEKKSFRKETLLRLNDIKNKNEKIEEITKEILSFSYRYHSIGVYAAMENELNLDLLIKELLAQNKTVSLPRVEGNELVFYQLKALEELEISTYGIREPKPINKVNKENIELILVPGVAFDRNNNRLGRGKGYYDRYLADYKGKKVGVCFTEQLYNDIPHNDRDIKMDKIVCPHENKIFDSKD